MVAQLLVEDSIRKQEVDGLVGREGARHLAEEQLAAVGLHHLVDDLMRDTLEEDDGRRLAVLFVPRCGC